MTTQTQNDYALGLPTQEGRTIALRHHLFDEFTIAEMNDLAIAPFDHDESLLSAGTREYLVLTNSEATRKAEEAIRDSLWVFNAAFILKGCNPSQKAIEAFTRMQGELCEDANEVIYAIIGGDKQFKDFADDAIKADGRGHFLSSYDGKEHEQGDFFIYRVN